METQLYYIHGLYGSNKSYKYLELKEKYPNIECLTWTENDNINLKLEEWKTILTNSLADSICVIASSTGCNFAFQLRELVKPYFIKLVFINPLFNVSDVFKQDVIPKQLVQYLVKIETHSESLILFSKNDEVLNNKKYISKTSFFYKNNKVIIDINSTHNFENIKHYYSDIDKLIDAIYL